MEWTKQKKRIVIGILFLLVVLLIALWLSLSSIIKSTLINSYQKRGVDEVRIAKIDYSIFSGRLNVQKLEFVTDGNVELQIAELTGNVNFLDLLGAKLKIRRLLAKEVTINIRKTRQGWRFVGVKNWARKVQRPVWYKRHINIKGAAIKQLKITMINGKRQIPLKFASIKVNVRNTQIKLNNQQNQQLHSKLVLSGNLDSCRFKLESTIDYSTASPSVQSRLSLSKLPMKWLKPWAPGSLKLLKGDTEYQGEAKIVMNSSPQDSSGTQSVSNILLTHKGTMIFKSLQYRIKSGTYEIRSKKLNFTTQDNSQLHFDLVKNKRHFKSDLQFTTAKHNFEVLLNKATIYIRNAMSSGFIQVDSKKSKGRPKARLKISAAYVTSKNLEKNLDLLELNNLIINKLSLSTDSKVTVDSVRTGRMRLVHRSTAGKSILTQFSKQLFTARTVQMISLLWSPQNGLNIKNFQIRNSQIFFYRENHQWKVLKMAVAMIKQLEIRFPQFQLARLELLGNNRLSLVDKSFDPAFQMNLDVHQLVIRDINSARRNSRSRFHIEASSNSHTKYTIDGYITPFKKSKEFDMTAQIKELELSQLNPYSTNYYGYKLNAGILDAKITVRIKKNIFTGTNQLLFTRLDVDHSTANVKDKRFLTLRLPINLIVSLLSNASNQLKIEFPVKLNLDDPKGKIAFSYLSALNLSVRKTIIVVLKYTQPIGRAFTLLRQANTLLVTFRLRPIIFEPGSSLVSQSQHSNIKKIALTIKNNKRISVKICPKYVKADLDYFRNEDPLISKKQLDRLAISLSKRRGKSIKAHLIRNYKIQSRKMIICKPKLSTQNDEEASQSHIKPRVDVSI